jgi:hypothetical protein
VESVPNVFHGAVAARDALIRQVDVALIGTADHLFIALSYREDAAY